MIMSTKEICKRGLSMTISLTLGNTGLPLGDRLAADVHLPGQGLLAHPGPPAVFSDPLTQRGHGDHLLFRLHPTRIGAGWLPTIRQRLVAAGTYRFKSRLSQAASGRFTV